MFWGKKAVVRSLFSREDTYFLCEKVGNFKCISGDFDDKTSVIRQKGESLNGCYKKTKHVKFSEKWTFLTLRYTYVRAACQEVRNVRAFFFFCNTSFEIHPFALLPTKTCLDWSLKSIMMKQEDESTYKIKMSYRQSKSPFPLSHLIQTHCLMVLMFCENSLFFWFWWHLENWRYMSQ